jgi:hypothetical protein
VLGMPPAFVLSQDQTLKFIPDLLKGRPNRGPPNVRIDARTSGRPSAAVRASLPIFSTISINNPHGPATGGPRLYARPAPLVNSRFAPNIDRTVEAGFSFDATGARRIIDRVVTREPDPRKGVASA